MRRSILSMNESFDLLIPLFCDLQPLFLRFPSFCGETGRGGCWWASFPIPSQNMDGCNPRHKDACTQSSAVKRAQAGNRRG